jgi:hypothetical protein
VPEPSLTDRLLELVDPRPKEAEAAGFPEVVKLLQKLGPKAWKALDPKSKAALERLTMEYPAVEKAGLEVLQQPKGTWEKLFKPRTSHWKPPGIRLSEQGGKISADFATIPDWVKGTVPQGFGKVALQRSRYSPPDVDPALHYGHESSHVLSGPLFQWAASVPENIGITGMAEHPARSAMEGFAEGASHAMLNRYDTGRRGAPYWAQYYKGNTPKAAKEAYLKSGYLGKDVGSAIRGGETIDQRNVIDLLMSIINMYR